MVCRRILVLCVIVVHATSAYTQWKLAVPNLLPGNQMYITFVTNSGGMLWAGGYRQLASSTDGGKTWVENSLDQIASEFYYADFYNKDTGVVATAHALWLTTNGGKSWNKTGPGAISRTCFAGSSMSIKAMDMYNVFYSSTDAGATWTSCDFGAYNASGTQDFALGRDGNLYALLHGDLPTRQDGPGWIDKSTDGGTTWTQSSGITEADSWTLSEDSCNPQRYYMVNENLVHGYNNQSQLFVTTNAGDSWQSVVSMPIGYFSGSLITTRSAVYAGLCGGYNGSKPNNGVLRSTDRGSTWKFFPGPGEVIDSRSIAALTDNTLFIIDNTGSLWYTENGGGDSVHESPLGVAGLDRPSLFENDTLYCDSNYDIVHLLNSDCNPATITSVELEGRDSDQYSVISIAADSVLVRCAPTKAGDLSAQLRVHLSDGTARAIRLAGVAATPVLSLTTGDQRCDTIGGKVHVPIRVSGLRESAEIELTVSFDNDLVYEGTFDATGTRLDIPGTTLSSRSRIRLHADPSADLAAWAVFDVLSDSMSMTKVDFDSVVIASSTQCYYTMPAVTSASIYGPNGCGIKAISDFMRGIPMQVRVWPNPTDGRVTLESTVDVHGAVVEVVNALGVAESTTIFDLSPTTKQQLDLPKAKGLYYIRISSTSGYAFTPIIVSE